MDHFPKCKVCDQHFKLQGPAPFLLPCLHAVCQTCVTSAAGGVLSCSTCQREVNPTETHLKKDLVRQREIFHLTVQHSPTEVLCTHDDDGNQAVCWCQECEEFFCEHCQTLHETFKATRRHAVQEMADIQPTSSNHDEYCQIHKNCPLDLWDPVCKILICYRCRRDNHPDHNAVDTDVAAKALRGEVVEKENEVNEVGVQHSSLLDKSREQIQQTNERAAGLRERIGHTFHSMKSLLDQREKELLVTLQQNTDETNSHLDSKSLLCQFNTLKCKTNADYIHKALVYSSKYDLLKLSETITETAQNCLDSAPPKEQEDVSLSEFHTVGLEKLKATCSSFGEVSRALTPLSNLPQESATQTETDYFAELEYTVQQNKETIDSLEKSVENYEETVRRLQHTLKEIVLTPGAIYHPLTTSILDKTFILQCIQLKFDRDRVNINKAHITTEGELVNTAQPAWHDLCKVRLVKYWGTTSTAPLPLCGSPQYWEVRGNVGIDKTLTGNLLLLEIGLCVEEERDQHHCIDGRPYSYSLTVANCSTHSSICRKVKKHGKSVLCLPNALPNPPGHSATLQFGVAFDDSRCRVVFFDLNTNKVLSVIDEVDCSRPLWPMFGVYNPTRASVSLSIVVGSDIDMSEEKKAMILKSLS